MITNGYYGAYDFKHLTSLMTAGVIRDFHNIFIDEVKVSKSLLMQPKKTIIIINP